MELAGSRFFPLLELLYHPPPHIRFTNQPKAFVSKTRYNYKQNAYTTNGKCREVR